MVSPDMRKEFMMIIGETYDQYGYPEYCGWIEGLLLLEQKEWSQRDISQRLGEIFPESKYPTSVPSVNRALKILESYGVVERTGSRKTGFRYSLLTSSNLLISMLQQLQIVNLEFIKKMEALEVRKKKRDPDLARAISYQIEMANVWNDVIEELMKTNEGGVG
ncbi:hypothetical protein EU527_08235 [Candidatus Thorarchaeota archaeon]|nr:MAG: hypothetical protein EU527_08235 [Candidatus Thorarchaeota archaeon]